MKNYFSLFLCLLVLSIFSDRLYSQEVVEMHVKVASKNLIVANKGKNHGVQKNSIYTINREGQIIGKAKVMLIEENLSGLKVINITPGFYVKDGDILIINSKESKESNIKQDKDNDKNDKGHIFRPLRPYYCSSTNLISYLIYS